MPRPKKSGATEPKKRSRNGCWPCKARKVKCDETHPACNNCQRQSEICDYRMRLNWEGRGRNKAEGGLGMINFSGGSAAAEPSRPSTGDSSTSTTQMDFGSMSTVLGGQEDGLPRAGMTFRNQQLPQYSMVVPNSGPETLQSMIDPSLTSSSTVSLVCQISYDGIRTGQPSVSRVRQVQELEDSSLSPSESVRSPTASTFSNLSVIRNIESPTSTPPFFGNGKADDRPLKRARIYQSKQEVSSPSYDVRMPPPNTHSYNSYANATVAAPSSTSTPSSSHSDESYKLYPTKLSPRDSPDLRRLSVDSLLSGPAGIPAHQDRPHIDPSKGVQDWSLLPVDVYQNTRTYGIDRGFKDLDIGKNHDAHAISRASPLISRAYLDQSVDGESGLFEFGFGMETSNSAFETGASYYDKPVEISIPRILEPLPNKLLENPMNLLYFHHFLNHTAGCLIPHNCSSNPFKSILPQMAVQDDNLLNLLLAYSASHRARHLRQPEPAIRIAEWMENVFPDLRHALNDPSAIISNANLATAIMLASLEIISPKAFGVEVPWQNHLDTARQMIAARGGPQLMQAASRGDQVSSFLWSWFLYLDVLGSLSGGKSSFPSSAWIMDYDTDIEKEYSIDCILGFTSRCVHILAKIAELARICDSSRIGPDHTIRADWQPSEDVVARAEKLESDLAASRLHSTQPCTHMQSTGGEAAYQWDNLEMAATNEAFHWAGLVHLHRRILGKPSTHDDVQNAVREIFGALFKVRRGSSAEACLLFPMFTAGCDIKDASQRSQILSRVKSVERLGMTQVHNARTLMERVWETGRPWETLVAGEFFG